MKNRLPLTIAALVAPLHAQEPATLVLEGDSVAGVGLVTRIDNLMVNDAGNWLVEADTDNADTDADQVLVGNAFTTLREGDALPLPIGATLDSFDSVTLSNASDSAFNFFLDGTAGIFDDSGIYLGTTLLIQEGDFVDDVSLTPNTPYIGFFDAKINDSDRFLIVASIDDSAIPSSVDRALVVLDVSGGSLQSTSVLWKEGDVLPGQTETITDFGTGVHESAFNASGDVLFSADLTGDAATNAVIYLGSTLLAQEGSPSPVAARNWDSLTSSEVDLNGKGEYVYSGRLDGDDATDILIVKNGAKLVQELDSPAAISPFQILSFGTGPVLLSDFGDVLWFGDWDDPDTDVDTGLFLNDRLLVQEGVTQVGGVTIDDVRGIQDGYAMSDDGRYIVFEALLVGGDEGAFLIDLGLGTNYCIGAANSVGVGARITARGSDVVADNHFTLKSASCPATVPGLFYFGPNQIQVPFGEGFRCVGGTTKRIQPPTFTDACGRASRNVDLTASPAAGNIVAGVGLNFQYWYRDPMGGPNGFNLSDATHIDWQ